MGALTSKPYAFSFRPWEFTSVITSNFYEQFEDLIQIDFRGQDIQRILPQVRLKSSYNWISNTLRFGFDGFSLNRLFAIINDAFDGSSNNVPDGLGWPGWPKIVSNVLDKVLAHEFFGLWGELSSVRSVIWFSNFLSFFNIPIFEFTFRSPDLRYWVRDKNRLASASGSFVFLGFNNSDFLTKFAAHQKLIRGSTDDVIFTFLMGHNKHVDATSISLSMVDLFRFFAGKSKFCQVALSKSHQPMHFIWDESEVSFFQFQSILDKFFKCEFIPISPFSNVFQIDEYWQGMTYYESDMSNTYYGDSVFSFLNDDIVPVNDENFSTDRCYIYCGAVSDRFGRCADIVLPSTSWFESSISYYDQNGIKQHVEGYSGLNQGVRQSSDIFRALVVEFCMRHFKNAHFVNQLVESWFFKHEDVEVLENYIFDTGQCNLPVPNIPIAPGVNFFNDSVSRTSVSANLFAKQFDYRW